jgi:hypothetical protein
MRLSSIRILPTLHGCQILKFNRFWGTHAAEYQGQFTRLDCQDHYRGHRRTDGLTGFEAIFKATTHTNDAAKVNGEEISQNELSQAVDMQRRQLMQQLGKDFDASLLDEKMLRESALKG